MLGLALQVPNPQGVELATEVVSGVLFALGLVYTGMVRPSKVRAAILLASAALPCECWAWNADSFRPAHQQP